MKKKGAVLIKNTVVQYQLSFVGDYFCTEKLLLSG